MLELFREIDEKATQAKAKKILQTYRRLCRIAGSEYTLRSTSAFSDQPRSKNNQPSKGLETFVVKRLDAEREIAEIDKAINLLSSDMYKEILIRRFCKARQCSNICIYMELDLSESEFYREQSKALLEFAEWYKAGELLVFKP
ncbi:ArpU family phage packaging/lysis transcriptional regulator [Streptococcus anginosus]|uniref:ArpU family phage packaging/lysis transcriptional regulator n=1 Tax=Streptococcus anginosus TaxID=1328 RepID=UPI0019561CA2|nr:ArpU family phage packaging/lysis transcriptional regulator [Streptococcus anginosus]VTY26974.1 phage_arpU: phage transcriptional regulator, ArpU family [Streptococcus anginosus]